MTQGPGGPTGPTQTDGHLIEVQGCLSRTDWEIVYLAAVQFAHQQGLTIERFDLQSRELSDQNGAPQSGLSVS